MALHFMEPTSLSAGLHAGLRPTSRRADAALLCSDRPAATVGHFSANVLVSPALRQLCQVVTWAGKCACVGVHPGRAAELQATGQS